MPGDDEFEDEPEDELASVGMHVVESDDDADDETKKPDEELDDVEAVAAAPDDEEKDEDSADEPPSALKELEEMEKEYLSKPLTIDNYIE
jgi:hypothetical protein